MNERIRKLDTVWSVYEEWLADCDKRMYEHRRQLNFLEYLHTEYKKARGGER